MFFPKISQWVLKRHTGFILRHGWKEGLKKYFLEKKSKQDICEKMFTSDTPACCDCTNKQSRNQKDDIEFIKKKWIPLYGKPKQRVC